MKKSATLLLLCICFPAFFISCVSDEHTIRADSTDRHTEKAKAVIEKYAAALGGRERLEQIHSGYISYRIRFLWALCVDIHHYERTSADPTQTHLYTNLDMVHFLGQKLGASLLTDTSTRTYVFFKRTKKGIPYLMDYRQYDRPLKHITTHADEKQNAYAVYSSMILPGYSNLLVRLFYPSERYDLHYYGHDTKKTTSYDIIQCTDKKHPNQFILYYFDTQTQLLTHIKKMKTEIEKNGQLRHEAQSTITLSDYTNPVFQGIAYPIKREEGIVSEKVSGLVFNLSEKEVLAVYPYFRLLDSAVQLRAGLLHFKE